MESSTSLLLSSQSSSLGLRLGRNSAATNRNFSLGHFNKHLEGRRTTSTSFQSIGVKEQKLPLLKTTRTHLVSPLRSSFTGSDSVFKVQPLLERFNGLFSFEKFKTAVSEASPFQIVKWLILLAVPISAAKWTVNTLVSPLFWSYLTMAWVFWPWMLAVSLALYGIYCSNKHTKGEANTFEQLAVVTSLITWLTVVPPAHVNGFLEGWPVVFFFVYHYFFFLNITVRERMYGDCYERPHDSKWDNLNPPNQTRALFCIAATIGHWFAALEAPELHLIKGGLTLSNVGVWMLIVSAIMMQYNAITYLAKYSEKVVVPTSVVQFGPYRWVRHPMYSSTILLFAAYFTALRAPLSLLFVVAVSVVFYDKKAKLEEGVMIESFGEKYVEYMNRVQYKFIPFVY